MLCACGVQEEPVIDEPQSETEKLNIADEVSYLGENGKYGFHNNGVPVTEAVFDEIIPQGKIEHRFVYFPAETDSGIGKIYAGAVTDGKRKSVDHGEKGGTVLIEEPNTNYILYESGADCVINETPLSNFSFLEPNGFVNSSDDFFIRGAFEGDYYEYKRESDGEWELNTKESGGITNWMDGKPQHVRYFWSWVFEGHGIADSEGNIILEPIYSKTEIINESIIAWDGYGSNVMEDIASTYIFDFEGNIISDEYVYIKHGISEIGKFVLTAEKIGEDNRCNAWFIDEKGNKLSEMYNGIMLINVYDEFGFGAYQSEAQVTEMDKTEIISTKEYACDYK